MSISQEANDRRAYALAMDYLVNLAIPSVTTALIEKYLSPFPQNPRPTTKQVIYQRLLESAQTGNMKAGVIGRSIGGVTNLGAVLSGFDSGKVRDEFGEDWQGVLEAVVTKLKPNGKIRRTPRSIWPKYCQTILSAAAFLDQFPSAEAFCQWADHFDHDPLTRPALPLVLAQEIDGFGFAVACDFLKEIGYVNFPKPDVHLRDIFAALGFCPPKPDDYTLFKAIVRLAGNADVTPYAADKVFWLIGSGYFYDDLQVGKNGRIGSRKGDFIARTQTAFSSVASG